MYHLRIILTYFLGIVSAAYYEIGAYSLDSCSEMSRVKTFAAPAGKCNNFGPTTDNLPMPDPQFRAIMFFSDGDIPFNVSYYPEKDCKGEATRPVFEQNLTPMPAPCSKQLWDMQDHGETETFARSIMITDEENRGL